MAFPVWLVVAYFVFLAGLFFSSVLLGLKVVRKAAEADYPYTRLLYYGTAMVPMGLVFWLVWRRKWRHEWNAAGQGSDV